MGRAFFISDSLTPPPAPPAPAEPGFVVAVGPGDVRLVEAAHLGGVLIGRVGIGGVLEALMDDGLPILARNRLLLNDDVPVVATFGDDATPAWSKSLVPKQVDIGRAALGRGGGTTKFSFNKNINESSLI